MKCSAHREILLPWICIAASAVVLTACSDPEARETSAEKSEWSILQAAEVENRAKPLAGPTIQTISGREVLGLRGTSGGNVWILLKPVAPPYYKQMPNANYEVPKPYLEHLIQERRVSYTVEHVLLSRADTK
jgi:hypothetical protein